MNDVWIINGALFRKEAGEENYFLEIGEDRGRIERHWDRSGIEDTIKRISSTKSVASYTYIHAACGRKVAQFGSDTLFRLLLPV